MENPKLRKKFERFVDDALVTKTDSEITALEQDMYDENDDYEIIIDLKNSKESLMVAFDEVCKKMKVQEQKLDYGRLALQAIREYQRVILAVYVMDAKSRHKLQEFCDHLSGELLRTEGAGSEIELKNLKTELEMELFGNEIDQNTMTDVLNKIRTELNPERAERVLGVNPEDLNEPVGLDWLKGIIMREWLRVSPKRLDGTVKTTKERISETISEVGQAFTVSLRDGSNFDVDNLVGELFEPYWISKFEVMQERLSSEPKEGSVHKFIPKKK